MFISQNQFRPALGSAVVSLDAQCDAVLRGLEGLRREYVAKAATPPLTGRLGTLPALPLLLTIAVFALLAI